MPDSDSPNKRRERIFRYAPLFLWIVVIFVFSSSTGSMSNTSRFIRPFLEWFFPGTPEEILIGYHGYLRKFAHFAVYAVLAFWAWRAFWRSSKAVLCRYWFIWAFLTVALTASLDEFNQSFNTLRTGAVYDVLLDTSGGVCMILFILAVKYRLQNK